MYRGWEDLVIAMALAAMTGRDEEGCRSERRVEREMKEGNARKA